MLRSTKSSAVMRQTETGKYVPCGPQFCKNAEAKQLSNGVYCLYWKSGGCSIGRDIHGIP